MRPEARRIARGALAALLLLCLPGAGAAPAQQLSAEIERAFGALDAAGSSPKWAEWDRAAEAAEALLHADAPDDDAVSAARSEIEGQRVGARSISAAAGVEIERLTLELDALGPAPLGGAEEPADVARTRADLQQRIADAKTLQGRADRVAARAESLLPALAQTEKRWLIERLTTPGPSPANPQTWIRAAEAARGILGRFAGEVRDMRADPAKRARLQERAPIAIVALVFSVVVGLGLRNVLLAVLRRLATGSSPGRRILAGTGAAFVRLLTLTLAVLAVVLMLLGLDVAAEIGRALVDGAGAGALAFVFIASIAAAFFSPRLPETRLTAMSEAAARSGYRAALALGAAFVIDGVAGELDETLGPDALYSAATFCSVLIGSAALWRIAQVTRLGALSPEGGSQAGAAIRRALYAMALTAPFLAFVGYDFAARSLFFSFAQTLGIAAIGWMIFRVADATVDLYISTHDGKGRAGERLRLLPILVGFLLICAALPILALVWGATTADLADAWRALATGLVIGDVAISPVAFFVFAIVFAIGYAATRAAQRALRNAILPKTGMSAGGAEALASVFGYVGICLAAAIGVSAAGINLSSLALVVGALSVGIGLGLQGVVNNFVSGIILLIERPVKVGDWIDVGGVNGYVRKVNVRSTEIETFDHSTYILPNSGLISGPVTNYTHHSTVGRVCVPVGVAYGTDTRRVEAILLEIGRAHPLVLSFPAPAAFFMGFGESSLGFELRVMIRDVNSILVLKSELNHRIAERFAAEGIEIPFPQRDLRLRDAGPLAAVLAAAEAAARAERPAAAARDEAGRPGAAEAME